jgi:Tfp pilus assembly protein PilO
MKFHFSQRERVITYAAVFVLAGYMLYSAGYHMFWLKWQGLQNRKTAAQRVLEQKKLMLKRHALNEPDRQQRLEAYRQNESDEQVRSKMLRHLQDLSSKNSVRIVDMKPVQVRKNHVSQEFPVSMTVEGGFVDMMKFFYDIEAREQGFQIQEFRFSQTQAARSALRCQAVVARIFLSLE